MGALSLAMVSLRNAPLPDSGIRLGPAVESEAAVEVEVEAADPARLLSRLRAVFFKEDQVIEQLNPLTRPSDIISLLDLDVDGRLTPGDRFRAPLLPAGLFRLHLIREGELLANATWRVLPPSVSLWLDTRFSSYAWNVTSASPPKNLSGFYSYIFADSIPRDRIDSLSSPTSRNGVMSFHDVDADGFLTVGDSIKVRVDVPGEWELYLVWRNAEVAHVFWTV